MVFDARIEYDQLKRAIQKSPQVIADETDKFLVRAQSEYKRSILGSPWRMGQSGGGVPVGTGSGAGNLKNSHTYKIEPFKLVIGVNESRADYAPYVHGIKGYPRKRSYQLRPWLRHAEKSQQSKVDQHAKALLNKIVKVLGR